MECGLTLGPFRSQIVWNSPDPGKPTVPRLPGGRIVFETLIAFSWPVLYASHEAIPSETSAAFCRSDEFPRCGLRPPHPRHPVEGGSGPSATVLHGLKEGRQAGPARSCHLSGLAL